MKQMSYVRDRADIDGLNRVDIADHVGAGLADPHRDLSAPVPTG